MTHRLETVEDVRSFLFGASSKEDTSGLVEVARARRAAHDAGRGLCDIVVYGCVIVDTFGQTSSVKFELHKLQDVDLRGVLPQVISVEELRRALPGISYTATFRTLPGPDHRCAECGSGWTIPDCTDSVRVWGDFDVNGQQNSRFEHVLCHRLSSERNDFSQYSAAVAAAGLDGFVLTAAPNEYDGGTPWCRMKTPRGDVVFGWRKRVVNVDWTGAFHWRLEKAGASYWQAADRIRKAFSADTLFPDEGVTKGEHYIHAWTMEKLSEYLRTLAMVMGVGPYKPGGAT